MLYCWGKEWWEAERFKKFPSQQGLQRNVRKLKSWVRWLKISVYEGRMRVVTCVCSKNIYVNFIHILQLSNIWILLHMDLTLSKFGHTCPTIWYKFTRVDGLFTDICVICIAGFINTVLISNVTRCFLLSELVDSKYFIR